jgi:tetratricopeptide (TPR) repeat protein
VAGQAVPDRIAHAIAGADKAYKEGRHERAFELLDDAARMEPASKMPWLRRAQVHFELRQYGQAIQSAHEALQRDPADLTAKSILAVSGLRVSAEALDQLRKVNEVNGSTRAEAESVARLIRDALGEPILVEAPAAGPVKAEPRPAAARPARPATAKVVSAPAGSAGNQTSAAPTAPAASAKPQAATGSPTKATNPFGSLK